MKEKTKKIILYILMCVITIGILFFAIRINKNRLEELDKQSKIGEYLTELNYYDVPEYLFENPNAIVYVSNSSEDSSKEFENTFKKVIKDYNLENDIVYINIYELNTNNAFYNNAPEILFYKDGVVSDAISCDALETYKDIVKIFKERGVIGD